MSEFYFRYSRGARDLCRLLVETPDGSTMIVDAVIRDPTHAVPLLRRCLRRRECSPDKKSTCWEDTPFQAVTWGLAQLGYRGIAPVLIAELKREHNRRAAVRNLATLACDESIAFCLEALHDEDVKSAVTVGIGWAIKRGHASPKFLSAMFDALVPFAAGEAPTRNSNAPRVLVDIHKDRAEVVLASERCIRIENGVLHAVLGALNNIRARVEPRLLLPLIEHTRENVGDYFFDNAHARAVTALALSDPIAAKAPLHAALRSTSQDVREGAVEGMRRVYGLRHPLDSFPEESPRPAHVVWDVMDLKLEIETNGMSALFVNHRPLWWRQVIASLDEIEAPHTAALVRAAARVVGLDDPALTDATAETSRINWERATTELKELGGEFYSDPDHLDIRVFEYMCKHAGVFRER